MCQCTSIDCNKCAPVQDVDGGEGCVFGVEHIWELSVLLFCEPNVNVCESKTALKTNLFLKKGMPFN